MSELENNGLIVDLVLNKSENQGSRKYTFSNEAPQGDIFSKGLTEYANNYPCEGIMKILNFIAPEVKASRRFEFLSAEAGDFLINEYSFEGDGRAVRAEFASISTTDTLKNGRCSNYGLTTIVERGDDFFVKQAIRVLKRRLLLQETFRAIEMLKKIATTEQVSWVKGGQTNPLKSLRTLIKSVAEGCTVPANRVLFGVKAWDLRSEYYDDDSSNYLISPNDLALKLAVESILIGNEMALVTNKEGATVKKQIVPDNFVFAFTSAEEENLNSYSSLKRFTNGDIEVFISEKSIGTSVTVCMSSAIVQTSQNSIRAFEITEEEVEEESDVDIS